MKKISFDQIHLAGIANSITENRGSVVKFKFPSPSLGPLLVTTLRAIFCASCIGYVCHVCRVRKTEWSDVVLSRDI